MAALELGNATAFRIAEKAGLAQSTTHDVLRELMSRGLVSSYLKGSKKYFAAADPETLASRVRAQTDLMEELLPELQSVYNARVNKPKVRHYDGTAGIDVAAKEFLSEAKTMRFFSNPDYLEANLPEHFPVLVQKRIEKGIKSRSIYVASEKGKEYHAKGESALRESRLINMKYDFHPTLWLWNDKVVFINTSGDLSTLIIENKEIALFFEKVFEHMWDHEQIATERKTGKSDFE